MEEKLYISYLKYLHGGCNIVVACLFFYHGLLGLRIRKMRRQGPSDLPSVKKHRKRGPVLVVLGIVGFLVGLTVVFFDHGHVFEHQIHFSVGLLISLLLVSTYLVSKKIRGLETVWRNRHFALGLTILALYITQVFIGLGELF